MDNIDKIIKELKGMDRTKRDELLNTLEMSMSESQQKKLKKMLSGKSGIFQIKRSLPARSQGMIYSKSSAISWGRQSLWQNLPIC